MTKPWADQPFTLIPTPTEDQTKGVCELPSASRRAQANKLKYDKVVIEVAREMCLAHNAMIRNLNAIYLQCEHVTIPKDQADFIIFCQAAIEVIHTHHAMEEANFFPQIAEYTGQPDIMERNIEQHRAFDEGLTTFEKFIYKLTPEEYNGLELKKLLESFASVLVVHLEEEIETLLALNEFGGEKLKPIFKSFNDRVMSEVKDKVTPFHDIAPRFCTTVSTNEITHSTGSCLALLAVSTEHSKEESTLTFLLFHFSYRI